MALSDTSFAPALPRRLAVLHGLRRVLRLRALPEDTQARAASLTATQARQLARQLARQQAARAAADRLLREARGPF